ncbi:unnamed protein product [Prorocentrum cordatum]|uniref:SPRY domain-containing protein n=1 Tax=Prorocentrum cordatum TaxID=2364126 RepID=A0ABN9XZY9_9DINO|nr:unnamed protein product [Polarella glacialis]
MECWLYMEVLGLNRMYCGRATATWQHEGSLTLAQRQAMAHLLSRAEVFAEDPFASVEVPALSSALQHAAIDYSGEPAVKALPCVLAELKPGLPQPEHAGALDACEFVDADIGAWLNDPSVALKPEAEWPNPLPRARVNVTSDSDWEALAVHLVELGIFTVLEPHEVFQVRGAPLLNGLFAVEKKGAPGPGAERVTRLILNMVPGNSLLKPFVGEASTLAASTGWTTLHLPEGSLLLWSGDDQKGAFFVWRIPRCWHAHMAVGKALRGDLFGRAAPRVFVASAVISMGWMLAVPLFQHIHRRLCRLPPPLGAGLPPEAEWRKDTVRPLAFAKQGPVLASWWQVYIDDFDAPEIIEEAAALELLGSQAELQAAARASYERAQVAISSDKAHLRQLRVERMGASVDGVTGRIGAPLSKALSACALAIATLGLDLVPWRLAMTVLGRIVRVFEFRRPLLSILNAVWRLSEPRAKVYLTREMREELMTALLVVPLAATSLRSRLEGMASCSDASEFGGGVCVSTGLHEQAEATILAAGEPGAQLGAGARVLGLPVDPRAPWTRSNPRIPRAIVARILRVLCIGLFDGIGGLAVALSRLPVRIVGYVSAETDAKARRVVRLRWPGAIDWGDVRTVTAQTVEDLRIAYQSEVDLVVAGAGSPCQGLTGLNAAGRGLADPKSSVFFEVPRIFGLLSDAFGASFRWFVENVAGMTSSSLRGMNQALGVKPVFLCTSALVPCRRPRLYWLSWSVRPTPPLVLQEREDMFVVSCNEPPLLNFDWRDPGARWLGEPGPYPTLVCSRPQRGYPSAPRGVKSASPEALARWQSDSYRYHVALYEEKNLLQDSDGSLRVPSSSERERMMGFDVRYTAVATKGSNQQDSDDARSFLLGNSFNVFSVAWLLQWLLLNLGAVTRPLSMQELRHVGECTPSWDEAGRFESDAGEPETEASRLLLLSYLARSEKGGSDVRLDVNLPYRPKGWPRSSLDPFVWKWRVVLSIAWPKRQQAHINVRELQAALAALRWRARAARRHCSRWLHLVDSQVVAAIITKGRSSSARLQPMLRRWAAVAVAADMYPLIGYIVSENNPADEPSRKLWRGSRLRGRRDPRAHTLSSLRVGVATRRRYAVAVRRLLHYYGAEESGAPALALAMDDADGLVAGFLEKLWAEGAGIAAASNTIAGVAFLCPSLRRKLDLSWSLLRTWRRQEPAARVLPLTAELVGGMAGYAIAAGAFDFACLLLVSFEAMLRGGEAFSLTAGDVHDRGSCMVIRIGSSKTTAGKDAAEAVVVRSKACVRLLRLVVANLGPSDRLSPRSPNQLKAGLQRLAEVHRVSVLACPSVIRVHRVSVLACPSVIRVPEPPKEKEEDAAPDPDKRPKLKETVEFLTKDSTDTTLNIMPSVHGNVLMALSDGGIQHLLAGARASVGISSGRYMFEVKMVELLQPADTSGQKGGRPPQPTNVLRIGFSTSSSGLVLGSSEDDNFFFDVAGSFTHNKTTSKVAEGFGRDNVVAVLLNLDAASPNADTVSLFRDGTRICQPQPIPDALKGKTLFPAVTFRNMTVHVNFGPTPAAPLPFQCRTLQDAAQKDCEVVTEAKPKTGVYDVLYPVCLPDEGTFDWLDAYLEKNPGHIELSDRMILDWADKSGIWRNRGYSWKASNDKPDPQFGVPSLDDGSIKKMLYSMATAQQRNFIVMEVQGNLTKEERQATLKKFSAPHFKQSALVLVGEPTKAIKDKMQALILKDKQEKQDLECCIQLLPILEARISGFPSMAITAIYCSDSVFIDRSYRSPWQLVVFVVIGMRWELRSSSKNRLDSIAATQFTKEGALQGGSTTHYHHHVVKGALAVKPNSTGDQYGIAFATSQEVERCQFTSEEAREVIRMAMCRAEVVVAEVLIDQPEEPPKDSGGRLEVPADAAQVGIFGTAHGSVPHTAQQPASLNHS